jgi:hypothetical protein
VLGCNTHADARILYQLQHGSCRLRKIRKIRRLSVSQRTLHPRKLTLQMSRVDATRLAFLAIDTKYVTTRRDGYALFSFHDALGKLSSLCTLVDWKADYR